MDARRFLARYGPWALVTGASSGIGEEFARQLAKRGLNIVLVARRSDLLESVAASIRETSKVEVRTLAVDLATPCALAAIREHTADLEIGCLVNNAGAVQAGALLWQDLESLENSVSVNVRVPTLLAHHFGRLMTQRGHGSIVFVASTFAYQGVPYFQQYAASKAYLLALGEAMHVELKDAGVDVSVLSPGPTKTAMQNMPGMDFSKLPLPWMPVRPVVRVGLNAIGKRSSTIAGPTNKIMATLTRHLAWRSLLARAFGWMVRRGLEPGRLVAGE